MTHPQPPPDGAGRAEFDAWAHRHFVRVPVGDNPVQRDGDSYRGNVGLAWIAWQAARRLSHPAPTKRIPFAGMSARLRGIGYDTDQIEAICAAVFQDYDEWAAPPPPAGSREAAGFTDVGTPDEMCPNCVTPWKCNGPHEPDCPASPAAAGEDARDAARYRWLRARIPVSVITCPSLHIVQTRPMDKIDHRLQGENYQREVEAAIDTAIAASAPSAADGEGKS